MAEKKLGKDSAEWEMFAEYWRLYKQYYEPEDNDEYWQEVVDATNAFYEKYKTEFARGLALQLVNELERRSRKRLKH